MEEARKDIMLGRSVVIGGDFNEPSHLDWQSDTKDLWDHNGAIVNWDCSLMLQRAGFKDTYRENIPILFCIQDLLFLPGIIGLNTLD